MLKSLGRIATALLFTTLISTSVVAAENKSAPAEIRIGGGGAAISSIIVPAADSFQTLNNIRLSLHVSTPAGGLIDLQKGDLDLVIGAVPFDQMLASATAQGSQLDPAGLSHVALGTSRTVVFTNKDVHVAKLSKEQLKEIFTGNITNWKQAGGADHKIKVVWGVLTPGQNSVFESAILQGAPLTTKIHKAKDYFDIRQKISEIPGAIGIDPVMFSNESVATPEVPEMSSPIVLITKRNMSPNVAKLVQFLKEIAARN